MALSRGVKKYIIKPIHNFPYDEQIESFAIFLIHEYD